MPLTSSADAEILRAWVARVGTAVRLTPRLTDPRQLEIRTRLEALGFDAVRFATITGPTSAIGSLGGPTRSEVAASTSAGALTYEGKMIDKPVVDRARTILARAGAL